ncbi:hypothetical protein IFM89_016376 [Coptis chinensis]|uniref:G-patch domain-containing protein n=1 Tax=Coptis chinensis TaxID=261450 RepID=A0A835LJK8_9MAGN|nr:hypothetical protein IFM89_016376 [Coptis chinensis]
MAFQNNTEEKEEEDEDYMGDLSRFLPCNEPKKSLILETQTSQPYKKKPKTLNWQEQRKVAREIKQREEDEKTLVNLESHIPQTNIGFKMLKQMGYKPGLALGKNGSGQVEPVGVEIRRTRAGIGKEDPVKERLRREEVKAEKAKKEVENLMVEFGTRKKSEWRSKRVVVNYKKAQGVIGQLENVEVVEPEKDCEGEEKEEEEEEEEEITEEDLHDILVRLREEHHYCLFCGFQYESAEALLSNCPGTDEDDH